MQKSYSRRIASFIIIAFFLMPVKGVYASGSKYKITQDDMIYFIMTDRFFNGDKSNDADVDKNDPSAYHGGDFQGIIDKLDYIKSLGFTTIWITPVVKNQPGGYHGYWTVDFYKTDEHLGTIDKLKELVQKAHSKDMKVIVDLVVNHTGQQHPWVDDPKYKDWFHENVDISDYNDQKLVENGWLAGLPDLNQDNPEVKKYLIDMAKWWIKETGIDGYRLDTMKHVSKSFWRDFTSEIKKDYPDIYLIGEVFDGNIDYVSDYQNTGVDGLLDYPAYFAITDVFKNGSPEMKLEDVINKGGSYKNRYLLGTFIDNHDVPRFINDIDKNRDEKLKQALAFMMTYTGIPIMYYGTEIGMDGGKDPDNRRDMEWSVKSPIMNYVKKLSSIRKNNKSLTRGDIKVLETDSDILCYSRSFEGNTITAAFNTSDSEKDVSIKVSELSIKNGAVSDLLDSERANIKDGTLNFKIEPLGVRILSCKSSNTNYPIVILPIAAVSLAVILLLYICKITLNKRRTDK
ncbi:MAG: alpha-amylase family glycosyl hydrolase [Clostridiales bacterium]|nr:alpha-amylase family glycosyl hydrolase [Clostridiales bacterium]HBM79326.1 alpha-amlyase [Clostridiaceae bacterium]